MCLPDYVKHFIDNERVCKANKPEYKNQRCKEQVMHFYTKHRKMKLSICLWVLVIFLVLSVESQAGGKKGNKQKSGRNKNSRKGQGINEKVLLAKKTMQR